ncbi:hypothetical protein BGY98DRAFT_1033384 [Russula aff. rugulosa BPL654]|nr:hypothetical protein BGY98DRAFT_1033384 [Russula aff. rugulosa BPL654]
MMTRAIRAYLDRILVGCEFPVLYRNSLRIVHATTTEVWHSPARRYAFNKHQSTILRSGSELLFIKLLLRRCSPLYQGPITPDPRTYNSADVAHPNIVEGNSGDPSDKLFSVYLPRGDKLDYEQSESSKGYMEGTSSLYTGLFSATMAAFLVESNRQLQLSSSGSDTVILLLSQINNYSLPSPVALPSPFHPTYQSMIFNHQPRPSA